jgi:hypothetical protein
LARFRQLTGALAEGLLALASFLILGTWMLAASGARTLTAALFVVKVVAAFTAALVHDGGLLAAIACNGTAIARAAKILTLFGWRD